MKIARGTQGTKEAADLMAMVAGLPASRVARREEYRRRRIPKQSWPALEGLVRNYRKVAHVTNATEAGE